MAIDPTNLPSSSSDLQRCSTTSVLRYSDSIISELFTTIPQQLRELKVSGRDSLFFHYGESIISRKR